MKPASLLRQITLLWGIGLNGCEHFDSSLCAGTNPSIDLGVKPIPNLLPIANWLFADFTKSRGKTAHRSPGFLSAVRETACGYVIVKLR
ncbi:MAG: hypothetical protein DME26_11995 [Verrucomicrobia bacterium]|nr:MAG: hypothetical protein DME26_11995 [Verrucomicrobiota bacterium]